MRGLTLGDPALLGGLGFNPLSLSPALWLDASDTSTITASGSPAKVSQWNDKSGNARNVTQATSAAQPTTGATTQNGLNVLSFDGGDNLSISASIDISANYTIAIVGTPSTGTDDYLLQLYRSATPLAQSAIITKFLSRSYESFNDVLPSGTARFTLGSSTLSGFNTLIVVRSGSAMSSLVNGSTSNSGTWTTSNYVWSSVWVGSAVNGNNSAASDIAEIIVFPSALTGADLTSVSNYLRTKWGTA